MNSIKYFYDVLIIGAGGAGLAAAIFAAQKGLNVSIASKIHPLKSHTVAAQGGINAVLGNVISDDVKWHIYDTLKAADGLADVDSVEYMCNLAPEIIFMLESLGVEFDRREDGSIDQKIYGGQTINFGQGGLAHRACYSKDRTGHSIMHKLYKKARSLGVVFFDYNFALDLIMQNNKCLGAEFWDIENGDRNIILANNTVLATGGYGQIYSTTTCANICTGDGMGLAARAGIGLQDMEFVQFHPTAIHKVGVLITEAARSSGAKLLNIHGERFMSKYAPNMMELATRDVVARAISTEVSIGNGAGEDKDHVWLDLTDLSLDQIKETLPTVYENSLHFAGVDPSDAMIPIGPAAHYNMGGVPTNNKCQVIKHREDEVVVDGLYAIGETACISVHGAGRLGCNSLLDLLVFAKMLGTQLNVDFNRSDHEKIFAQLKPKAWNLPFGDGDNHDNVDKLTHGLRQLMNKNVGVFRSDLTLQTAKNGIEKIEDNLKNIRLRDTGLKWNLELQHYLELKNMIICAKATVVGALHRKESRGAHWRDDYTKKNNDYLAHFVWFLGEDSDTLWKRGVRGSN